MFGAIIEAYRWFFLRLADAVGFGWGIVALSFITSVAMMPLMKAVAGVVKRETEYQGVILPQLAAIKGKYASDIERNFHIQRLYARYGYSPLSAIKKVLPLFVQIPFLLLTYYMLKNTPQLSGVKFLFLTDLGLPDALLSGFRRLPQAINLLPFVMTSVNLVTVAATPGFTGKDQAQAVGISLLFLVLLYSAPSALLLYWTLNNVITLLRTVLSHRAEGAKLLWERIKATRNLPSHILAAATNKVISGAMLGVLLLAFYFFVTARALVVLTMKRHLTYLLCFNLMCPLLLLAIVLLYWLLWKSPEYARRAVLFGEIAVFLLFAIVVALIRFVSQEVFFAVRAHAGRFAVFEVLAVFFLIPCLFRRKKVYADFWRDICSIIRKEWVLVLLPLVLAIHYSFSSTNITLSAAAIMKLCLYLVVPCVLAAFLFVFVVHPWQNPVMVFRVLIGFISGVYMVPLISTGNGVLSFDVNLPIRLLLIGFVVFALAFIKNRKACHAFLGVLLVLVVINAARISHAKQVVAAAERPSEGARTNLLEGVNCIRHNNVYFLIYDSYENLIVQQALGIADKDLPDFLATHGYKLYDAYSVGYHTTASMSAAFAIDGVKGGTVNSTIAGDNVPSDFLKANGYRTSFMLCGYTMPGDEDRLPGDFYYPTPNRMVPKEIVLYTCILRGILSQSPTTFNYYTREEWTSIKRGRFSKMGKEREFIYAHSGRPDHAPPDYRYRGTDEEVQRDYKVRLDLATNELKGDVEMLDKLDEDAIVILASDHGAYLMMPEVDKPDARHLLDRYGVFLAIRWPKDYDPCLKLNSLQNVMLEVLIYLTGDKTLARYENECSTLAIPSPVKTPAGFIRRGVIQDGEDKGKTLFDAAREAFEGKGNR